MPQAPGFRFFNFFFTTCPYRPWNLNFLLLSFCPRASDLEIFFRFFFHFLLQAHRLKKFYSNFFHFLSQAQVFNFFLYFFSLPGLRFFLSFVAPCPGIYIFLFRFLKRALELKKSNLLRGQILFICEILPVKYGQGNSANRSHKI